MIPIAQLLVAPTIAAFRAMMVTLLKELGVPADKWRAGGTFSLMLTVIATVLNMMAILVATAINGFFLPNATGQGLANLAFYVYGVTPPAATQASGYVFLVNTGGGVYTGPTYAAGKVYFENPTTGVTYVNTVGLNLGAAGGPNATQQVAVQATIFGTAGNANPGTITEIVTTLPLVTCTNPASVVGVDALGDAALRSLCTASLGARSVRGPRTAYQFAIQTALNSVSSTPVNINRWWISPNSSNGIVTVIVASPAGAPDPNDVTGVGTNIEAVARPMAVTANTSGATEIDYTATLTLYCSAPTGVSAGQLEAAAQTAITDFLEAYAIGGVPLVDDTHPTGGITGLGGQGVLAAAAEGIQTLGSTFYSGTGATDLALALGQVPGNATTVAIRFVGPAT